MKRYSCIMIGIFVLLLTAVGCSSTYENENKNKNENKKSIAVDILDMEGNHIELAEIPDRIVSLSPTNTELTFAVGAGDKLVGVTTYCDFPEAAKSIEKVGDFSSISLEKVVELNPDIVLAGSSIQEDVVDGIEALGIPVISTEAQNIEDIYSSLNILGALTGNETEAKKISDNMKSKIDAIKLKKEGKDPVSVFYVVWRDPFKTAGRNTFIDEAITLAGGKNIAGDVEGWADYSRETLTSKNPYGIIASKHFSTEPQTVETLAKDEIFKDLEATKNGHIYIMEDDSKISRGGPRIVEAIEEMSVAIESWS